MTTNTGFPVEKSGRRGASSSGAQISNNTPLSSPSFLIKKSLRPVVAKLLGVNANSNDQEQQHQAAEEQQQQQANKKMSGNVGQKRTRANNKQDCSGSVSTAGTSNDGSSIHTTTTTTDYRRLHDEEGDASSRNIDLDPIEQWRKQQHLQKKKEPHIIKELCLFLKNRSWKKKLMTCIAIVSAIPIILDVFILRSGHLQSLFTTYLEWMTYHRLLGSLAYVFILVLTSLIFIPPSILIFAAGFTFTSLYGKIGRTSVKDDQLLEDARRMRQSSSSSSSSSAANNNSNNNKGMKETIFDILSTIVTVDFFVVLALLAWFLEGIFCSYLLKDDTVQIAFNMNFQAVTQPALGILMTGSVAGQAFGKEEKEENES
jgi:hypothetical protein